MKADISLTDDTRLITNPRMLWGVITITVFLSFFILGVKWEASNASQEAHDAKNSVVEMQAEFKSINQDRAKNLKELMLSIAALQAEQAKSSANQENMQKSLDRIERLIERSK